MDKPFKKIACAEQQFRLDDPSLTAPAGIRWNAIDASSAITSDGEQMMPNPKQTIALRDLNSACSNIPSDTAATVRQVKTALRILRIRQLVERTGLSRATLYKLMAADPKFPKRVRLTPGTVGFLEAEVDAWIAARAELRTAVQYGDGHADYR